MTKPQHADQVFTFGDTGGVVRHFDISRIRGMFAEVPVEWPLVEMPIGRADEQFMLRHRGVEEGKVRALPLSALDEPGIACWMPDQSLLIIDGTHRLVKRVRRKLTTMFFYVGNEASWTRGLIGSPAKSMK